MRLIPYSEACERSLRDQSALSVRILADRARSRSTREPSIRVISTSIAQRQLMASFVDAQAPRGNHR